MSEDTYDSADGPEPTSEQLEQEVNAQFEPLVKLSEVPVVTGEEEEVVVYKQRCKLYRFDHDTSEWKERGTGDVKLLLHNGTKKVRILLRQEKTYKLCMNHQVVPEIELAENPSSDRLWTWATTDYADQQPTVITFAIKFKTQEIAKEFRAKYNECRDFVSGKVASLAAVSDEKKEDEADGKGGNIWVDILKDKPFDPISNEKLKELFVKYDKNNSNSIDASELQTAFSDLFDAICERLELPADLRVDVKKSIPSLASQALKTLDKNQDGQISWDEFQALNEVQAVTKAK